jgi:hypothetical protein
MDTASNQRSSARRRHGAGAAIAFAATLMLLGSDVQADSPIIVELVPKRVLLGQGASFRSGDWFALEPPVFFVSGATLGRRPIVVVARPILGVGGSGVGIGLVTNADVFGVEPEVVNNPVVLPSDLDPEPAPFWLLPMTFEAHLERMYGPTSWRSATYVGAQVSMSAYVLKASVGWMVNATDRTDHHLQLGLGSGF